MKLRVLKVLSVVFIMALVLNILSSCKKPEEKTTATGGKTVTATKSVSATNQKTTTRKTTVVSTTGADNGDTGDNDINGGNGDENNGDNGDDVNDNVIENDIDFGGQIIKFAADSPDYILTFPERELSDELTKIKVRRMIDAQAKYNFKAEWVIGPNGYANFNNWIIQNTLAGIKLADIYYMPCFTFEIFPKFTNNNNQCIFPIDEYIDFENDPLWKASYLANAGSWAGKRWGLTPVDKPLAVLDYSIIYNRMIFDKEGMNDPQPLAYSGDWTWDTFLDYAIKMTRDFNGDGITDQWGFETINDSVLFYSLAFSNGAEMISFDNGKARTGISELNSLRALNFIYDLFNVYKVSSRTLYATSGQGVGFRTNRSAMWMAVRANQQYNYYAGFKDAGLIPIPLGPDHSGPYINNLSNQFLTCFSIFIDESKRKDIVTVTADFLSHWNENSPNNTTKYWESALSLEELHCPRESDIRVMYDFAKNSKYQIVRVYGSALNSVIAPIVNGQIPPGSAAESMATKLQSVLDSAIN